MRDVIVVDQVLSARQAEAVIDVWHRYPAYTPIGQGFYLKTKGAPKLPRSTNPGVFPQQSSTPRFKRFAPGLEFRADANRNFLRTGGRLGHSEDRLLAARHKYFRETYVYGEVIYMPGIEVLLHNRRLLEAARRLHGRPIIVPAIVYANLMLPAQELGLHYDIPEFRGANIGALPGWLLVVMHLSGSFERWRVPLVTGIVYVGEGGAGGKFVCYPNGVLEPAVSFPARYNTAVVLETDSTLHGVDRIAGENPAIEYIGPGTRLVHDGDRRWSLRCATTDGMRTVARYTSEEIRCSVSWKAYCFADEAEREAWAHNTDDLTLNVIIERLVAELHERGRLPSLDHGLSEEELGLLLIDEFIPFPPAATAAEGSKRRRMRKVARGRDQVLRSNNR